MTVHTATATCQTPGCGNQGIGIPIEWDDQPDPQFPPAETPPIVVCGVCRNPIDGVDLLAEQG